MTFNVNNALELLRNQGIEAVKFCFKLGIMVETGYEEVKKIVHNRRTGTYVLIIAGNKRYNLNELKFVQKELRNKRAENNFQLAGGNTVRILA